jgi:hypothetical protein
MEINRARNCFFLHYSYDIFEAFNAIPDALSKLKKPYATLTFPFA